MTEVMMKMLSNSNSSYLDIMVEEHVADCCSCGEINSYPVSPCVCYTPKWQHETETETQVEEKDSIIVAVLLSK